MFRLLSAILLCFSLIACSSSKKDAVGEFDDVPAGKLYNDGLILLENGSFKAAAKQFDEVDRVHPYSHWARKAMVLSAFSHYRSRDYTTASETAKRFLALHPGDKDAAYAAFIMAESYNDQIQEVSRDQTQAQKALAAYQNVIRTYPDSKYAREAEKKIEFARDQIAGKELSVGRFYLGKRNYLAAINRFKVVVSDYQQTRHVEEALYRLVEANLALGLVDEAQTAGAILGHNFPQSDWYLRALSLLGKEGLAPEQNRKSWLSRTFGRA